MLLTLAFIFSIIWKVQWSVTLPSLPFFPGFCLCCSDSHCREYLVVIFSSQNETVFTDSSISLCCNKVKLLIENLAAVNKGKVVGRRRMPLITQGELPSTFLFRRRNYSKSTYSGK